MDCLRRHRYKNRGAKKPWPAAVYHNEPVKHCRVHHAERCANSMARHAGLGKATPAWADRAKIKAIYAECFETTVRTGIRHEVDHFYPLRGRLVSGLHVHQNLRVITRLENRDKSNRYDTG